MTRLCIKHKHPINHWHNAHRHSQDVLSALCNPSMKTSIFIAFVLFYFTSLPFYFTALPIAFHLSNTLTQLHVSLVSISCTSDIHTHSTNTLCSGIPFPLPSPLSHPRMFLPPSPHYTHVENERLTRILGHDGHRFFVLVVCSTVGDFEHRKVMNQCIWFISKLCPDADRRDSEFDRFAYVRH